MRRLALVILSSLLVMELFGCSASPKSGGVKKSQETPAAPLAQGFPKDFPLIEGKITACMQSNSLNGDDGKPVGTGYFTQIKTKMTPQQAMDFYKPKFSKITKQTPLKKGSSAMYSGYINNHPATIYFVDQKDDTMLTIIVTDGKK